MKLMAEKWKLATSHLFLGILKWKLESREFEK